MSIEKPAIVGGKPVSSEKIRFTEIIMGEEELSVVQEIMREKSFVAGEYIEKFEKEFAHYIGSKYAIAVSNGTDSLFLLYLAYNLTFNSKIVTTPVTFVATASTIIRSGAVPLFADILYDGNIDPRSVEKIVEKEKVNGIVVVHLYGKPVDMDPIMELAKEHNLIVIEDAAHAHGAIYKGKKAGNIGQAGSFSFYPAKVIGTAGWGGIITVNDKEIAEKIKLMRAHGELGYITGPKDKYLHVMLGFNMRISHIEAAVAYYQLKRLEKFISLRRKWAKLLSEKLADVPGIKLPKDTNNGRHVFYIYNILIDEEKIGWSRNDFVKALNAEGIEARRGYHIPLHKQPLFQQIDNPRINFMAHVVNYPEYKKLSLPVAEDFCRRSIWLPMHPNLNEEKVEKIAEAVKKLVYYGLHKK